MGNFNQNEILIEDDNENNGNKLNIEDNVER
jgi:hypothetical protein